MDGEALTGVAIVIGLVAIIGAIAFFAIRAEKRLQAALREMAEARGWQYETHKSRGFGQRRSKSSFTLTPADPAERWKLEVTRRSSSGGGRSSGRKRRASSTRTTDPGRAEFRAPEPAFQGGLAVFTTGATGSAMGMAKGGVAESMMGMFDNKIAKSVLGHFLGADMGEHLGQLKSFPAPEGSGLTVMATADPSMFFDMDAIGEVLRGWKPARGLFKSSPQLVVGEAGIRLFLSQQITDAEAVEGFIDLGLELRKRAMRNH